MIRHYPYHELGQHDYSWLVARYHFSFADYHNPSRKGFGALRVVNDDVIKAGAGFDTHPHKNMEIITYVRSGAITHRDSAGNVGKTEAGDIQVMSAGSGIFHSEFNLESEEAKLFQIWIFPKDLGIAPRWATRKFPKEKIISSLPVLASGFEEDQKSGALYIHQDARISGGRLEAGQTITQPIRKQAYLVVSDGEIELEQLRLSKGDGAEITEKDAVKIKAIKASEVVMIDVPSKRRNLN